MSKSQNERMHLRKENTMTATIKTCSIPSCPCTVDASTAGPITTQGWYRLADGGTAHCHVNTLRGGMAGSVLCRQHADLTDLVDWANLEGYDLDLQGVNAYQYVDDAAAGELNIDAVISCRGNAHELRGLPRIVSVSQSATIACSNCGATMHGFAGFDADVIAIRYERNGEPCPVDLDYFLALDQCAACFAAAVQGAHPVPTTNRRVPRFVWSNAPRTSRAWCLAERCDLTASEKTLVNTMVLLWGDIGSRLPTADHFATFATLASLFCADGAA